MKTGTKILIGAIAVVAVSGTLVMLPKAVAYQGNPSVVGPNHTVEREAVLTQIMSKRDFAAWKAFMTESGRKPGVLRIVDTQEEFNVFAEAWELSRTGNAADFVKAQELREKLGLGAGQGRRGGNRGQNNGGNFVDANKDGVCDHMQ